MNNQSKKSDKSGNRTLFWVCITIIVGIFFFIALLTPFADVALAFFDIGVDAVSVMLVLAPLIPVLILLLVTMPQAETREKEAAERHREMMERWDVRDKESEQRHKDILVHLEESRQASQKESDARFAKMQEEADARLEKILSQMREDSKQVQERFNEFMKQIDARDRPRRRGRRY